MAMDNMGRKVFKKNLNADAPPNKNDGYTQFKAQADKSMAGVFNHLKEYGRADDFLSILKHLSDGTLPCSNFCLHLLLDIGKFLSSFCIKNMRYSNGKDRILSTKYCLSNFMICEVTIFDFR